VKELKIMDGGTHERAYKVCFFI